MNSTESLIEAAKELFESSFDKTNHDNGSIVTTIAPGRVNLIGEHVDYTGGYVFPMAIGFSTVCYGVGRLVPTCSSSSLSENSIVCRIVSTNVDPNHIITFETTSYEEVEAWEAYPLSSPNRWANYVMGVVREYILQDLKPFDKLHRTISFDLAISGNVPLGSGLSSSASLEVSVARFVECILGPDVAFAELRSAGLEQNLMLKSMSRDRALRCQRADNLFCGIPCGVMDQYVSSAAEKGCALLIDCTTNDYTKCQMKQNQGPHLSGDDEDDPNPVIVICNSNVQHDNAAGEYPVRVQQCQSALQAIQKYDPNISSLRYATREHLQKAKGDMEEVIQRRVKHVITENERTLEAKHAFENGDFDKLGTLFNQSHESMRDDYETSCEEIDILVSLAQSVPGVYGSRLTGGGFGGCTVTLVRKTKVQPLIQYLKTNYMKKTGLECVCFVSSPEDGSRVIKHTLE